MIVKMAEANIRILHFFYACEYKINQILQIVRNCVTEIDKEIYFNQSPNFMKDPSS
jgi:hypothetical protein